MCAVHSNALCTPTGHCEPFTLRPSLNMMVTVWSSLSQYINLLVPVCSPQSDLLYTCWSLYAVQCQTLSTPAGHCVQFTVRQSVRMPVTVCISQSDILYTCWSVYAVHIQKLCTRNDHRLQFTVRQILHLLVTVHFTERNALHLPVNVCSQNHSTPDGQCVHFTVRKSVNLLCEVHGQSSCTPAL